jgi:hypothetical protein
MMDEMTKKQHDIHGYIDQEAKKKAKNKYFPPEEDEDEEYDD